MTVDLIILGLVYAALAWGGVPRTGADRTAVALIGAVAVMLCRRLSVSQAISTVDFSTLALLFGLMILSAQLRRAGFYAWLIVHIVRLSERPLRFLTVLVAFSAVLSAVFANDVVCLIFAPILCKALRPRGCDPLPYLLALATSSNIGSAAMLIGNPQNMLIGQTAHLSFGHYALTVAPLAVLCLALNVGCIWLLHPAPAPANPTPALEEGQTLDRFQVAKAFGVTALMLIGFFVDGHRDVVALCGAAVLLVSRRALALVLDVDWRLLLLFVGLFVVTGNVSVHHDLDGWVAASHLNLHRLLPLGLVTAALSNLVSNVPAVILLRTWIPLGAWPLWYYLAAVSTLAGNLFLIGSIANLIVAEQSARCGVRVSFRAHARVGVPLTLLTLLLAYGWFHLPFLRM